MEEQQINQLKIILSGSRKLLSSSSNCESSVWCTTIFSSLPSV